MTNPAVEALKEIEALVSKNSSSGGEPWSFFSKQVQKIAREAIAQAEQTPVAGRVVSEELYRQIERSLEVIDEEDISGFSYYDGLKHKYVTLKEIEEALRAAPTVAATSTGRVIGEELVSKIDDFLTDCEVGFHGYGPEEPKTLATAILKELRAQPSETVRREGE